MFNPNCQPSYHHRCTRAHDVFAELRVLTHRVLGIPRHYELLFLTGSGALGLEAAVWSATTNFNPLFTQSKFGEQLRRLLRTHNKYYVLSDNVAYVHYETSTSVLNNVEKVDGFALVDCVSSFPYYDIPDHAGIFVTVSGKQLGAPPGVVIVGVRDDIWNRYVCVHEDKHSYLNLKRYRLYARNNETPNTPALSTLASLATCLKEIDIQRMRDSVAMRWEILCREFGSPHGMSPPVYTFNGVVPVLHEELELYGKTQTQLFLYWGIDLEFNQLMDRLRRVRDEIPGTPFWWT